MTRLKDISVKSKLQLLSVLFVCAMAVFGLLSYSTLNNVKIGGAAYEEIALANDILSDFQAPTQFALEQRLRVYQMRVDVNDKVKLATETASFEHLMRRFEVGHTLWLNKVSDPKTRDLLQKIYEPGRDYQNLALTTYIPLLVEGKGEAADIFDSPG